MTPDNVDLALALIENELHHAETAAERSRADGYYRELRELRADLARDSPALARVDDPAPAPPRKPCLLCDDTGVTLSGLDNLDLDAGMPCPMLPHPLRTAPAPTDPYEEAGVNDHHPDGAADRRPRDRAAGEAMSAHDEGRALAERAWQRSPEGRRKPLIEVCGGYRAWSAESEQRWHAAVDRWRELQAGIALPATGATAAKEK